MPEGGDLVPEVGEFFDTKHAILPVYDHPVVGEEVKDLTKGRFMLLLSPAGNQDVIRIGEDEGDAPKNTVHQPLECLGGISKPKRHAEELPEPKGSDDGRLGDVCRCDGDLMVAADQIYPGKYLLARQAIVQIMYVGQGIPIIHSGIVEV